MVLACQEERTKRRKQLQEKCKQRAEDESFQSYARVVLESSTSSVAVKSLVKIMMVLPEMLDLPDKRRQKERQKT